MLSKVANQRGRWTPLRRRHWQPPLNEVAIEGGAGQRRQHDLKVERFYKTQEINGLVATKQGPIKTFTLRGIKESPPFMHDGRLLTLEDTVEFFNLILETKLTAKEKQALVAFMRQL